jgi:aminopeptidase N/puromycin-sensitive aminopeptidase
MAAGSFCKFAFVVIVMFLLIPAATCAQRLPQDVVPNHYKLFLDPNISGRSFSGEETIDLHVLKPASVITLNSLDLEIVSAEISFAGHAQTAKIEYDRPAEMARFELGQAVPAGNATLHLKFSGKLTEGLRGLYLSKSPRRMYAVTQFEGTYARMMFPCFDEPSFKATFDLSVAADSGDTAISNGRIISDEPLPGTQRHEISFSTSPRMSTYLVALGIGDWQCLQQNAGDVPVRVCAVPEKKQAGKFALEAAVHSIDFYNQWYGIKYPFGKLDMLAIPDYEWGGMENTAAIFYRESSLLMDPSEASLFSKQGHAGTIAHEIAHQWFGDLVTAAWWDDIWLNEGFATWMQSKPVEAWHPEWKLEEGAAASAQQIISLDSLPSARAIHGDPRTSAEIKEMFDGITYEKGAAVLRMLEAYVGPEVFRKGVNQYLNEHANGNASSQDFWRAMAQVSGKPVDKIMPTFVLQPGVPLVSLSGACRDGKTALLAGQQRFLIAPAGSVSTPNSEKWQIPICLKVEGNGGACYLMEQKQQDLAVNGCPDWYFANREAKGYYRVYYSDVRNLTKVSDAAEKELNAPERIALVEDTWAMSRAGKYSIGTFMYVAEALRSEHERRIVGMLAGHLETAETLVPKQSKQKYDTFIRTQFATLSKELGWESRAGEPEENAAMRATLLPALGGAGDRSAIAAANAIVRQFLKQPGSTDPTTTGSAFVVAAENGDSQLYDTLSAALQKATSTSEHLTYLFALTAFRQPELAARTLQLVQVGEVRQQDYPSFFASLLSNPASRPATWAYLKSHWEDLQEKVTSFGGRGAVSALGTFCTAPEKQDVKHFFANHHAPGAEKALQQSLEAMDSCIEFRQLQQTSMEKWLSQQP